MAPVMLRPSYAGSRGWFSGGLLVAMVFAPALLDPPGAAAFEPVDYRGAGATIRLSRLSTYDGGYFASKSAEVPPAYDANQRRLYYINKEPQLDRRARHRRPGLSCTGTSPLTSGRPPWARRL